VSLYESVRAVTAASGDGPIDWAAAAAAARAAVDPGSVELSAAQRRGYATDVEDARDRIGAVAGVGFDLPGTVEVQHRHHWIDANVATFERLLAPVETRAGLLPGVARTLNTGSSAFALAFLASNVLGQYDPLLLAESEDAGHALYFVHPNIRRIAASLGVPEERFRRWIAFHEVAHAAEFGAAPWLSEHLETRMEEGLAALGDGRIDWSAFRELDTAMTAVEGYAELVMDRAFDDEYADLRERIDARRRGRGPIARFVRRVLGLGLKRRQYERGKAFFDRVADVRGIEGASRVWERPENLPSRAELDDPTAWLARVPG
jgi:uncharacterized protein (DUF2342 family)